MINLLLVEDDAKHALLVRAMLDNVRDTQFEVAEAHTLGAAIAALEARRYDLILLDLGLPDSHDLATLTALRAVAFETPIVVVSADPDEHVPLQAVQGGAQDYLVKGTFNPVALGRVIQYSIERQRILRALHESERKYRALVEQASDSIFIGSAAGTLLEVNAQACALLGYTHAELVGMHIADLLGPLEPAAGMPLPVERLQALTAGKITRYEHLLRCRDGSYVVVELASKMLDDGRIQAIARDITERKAAEETLRARVRQEEAVATLGQQALATSDLAELLDTAVALIAGALRVEFSRVMELLPDGDELVLRAGFGWRPGLIGQATVKSDPSTQAGYTLQTGAAVIIDDLQTETRFNSPTMLADHGVVSGISVVIRNPDGPVGVLSGHSASRRLFSAYDVSFMEAVANILATAVQRTRAEQALRTSELQFRAVFDNTLAAIFIVDDERSFVRANSAACHLLGLPAEELIGRRIDDIIGPDQAPLLAPAWRLFLRGGTMSGEFTIKRPDGAERIIQLESTVGVLPGEHLLSMIDITAGKQAEQQRLVKERAEAANEAKSEFLAHMSHELRTPLNAILGFAQLLEMSELAADDRESVEQIMKAGRHLLGLINDVLDMVRVESGKLSLSPEPVSLQDVLGECVSLTAGAMREQGIKLAVSTAGLSDHPVQADRQRIKQVLLNLLSNAVKYNRRGGTLSVAYRREPGAVRLLISDTGQGIAPSNMSRLFTAFDRLGAETSVVEGTGLGLVISRQLMEAMGGSIGAESVAGSGSTFWLQLPEAAAEQPLERADADAPALQPADQAGPDAKRTILYIEDNSVSLSLVERIVQRRPNIRLLSAHSGLGFELVRQTRVDLVLLDLHLPEISGEEVLRRLQADPSSRDIPVVILSADATSGTIARLLAAGASGFLTKPLDAPRFLRILDTYVAGS